MSRLLSSAMLFALVATLLFVPPVYASAAEPGEQTPIDNVTVPENFQIFAPSLDQVSKIHNSFQAYVESGQASLAKGQQAQDIWLSLQQYLATQDAAIYRLENEITQPSAVARLKTVREIARRAAERESVIISSYLALANITDEYDHDFDTPAPIQTEPVTTQSDKKGSRIKIEFVAEDTLMDVLE